MKLWPLLLLMSCATTLTPEEVEWRRGIDHENWIICQQAFKQAGVVFIHWGHMHRRGIPPAHHEIRDDLFYNHCRLALGPYWTRY